MSVRRRKKSEAPPRQQPAKLKSRRRDPQPRPAPAKSARNERTNKQVEIQLDRRGKYAAACLEIAVQLGHAPAWVFNLWRQLALMRMFEQRLPQPAAEQSAMRDVKRMLDKRDTQGDAS